jgi:predicted Rossmann fold nucleotide-binding protein DprA/Smf involved in DNA uptake
MSAALRDLREVVREEPLMHRPILRALAAGPLTIPEIATAVGRPAHEVVVWVMGMRRYGQVAAEGEPDEDGYFQYRAVDAEATS